MSAPSRIARRRGRGWRLPRGAVLVGRPTVWANPFRVTRSSDYHGLPGSWFVTDASGVPHHPEEDTQRSARQKAVDLFAAAVLDDRCEGVTVERVRAELQDRDLACWCPPGEPCHADALLGIANPAPVAPAVSFASRRRPLRRSSGGAAPTEAPRRRRLELRSVPIRFHHARGGAHWSP